MSLPINTLSLSESLSASSCSPSSPSSPSPLLAFTLFPALPLELRLAIWDHACHVRRIITVSRKHACHPIWLSAEKRVADARLKPFDGAVPPILHVCREARGVGLRNYEIVDYKEQAEILSLDEANERARLKEERRARRESLAGADGDESAIASSHQPSGSGNSHVASTSPPTSTHSRSASRSNHTRSINAYLASQSTKKKSKGVLRLYVNFAHDVFFLPTADSLFAILCSISGGIKHPSTTPPCLSRIRRIVIGPNIFESAAQAWQRTLVTGGAWRRAEERLDEEDMAARDARAREHGLRIEEMTVLKWDVSSAFARMTRPGWKGVGEGGKTEQEAEEEEKAEICEIKKIVGSCYRALIAMMCAVSMDFEQGREEGSWLGQVKILEGLRVNYGAGKGNYDVDWSWIQQYRAMYE